MGIVQPNPLQSCSPPGDLPNPGIEPRSPALQVDSLPSELPGKPKNSGVGSLSLLQGIFPTQESNQGLLHCRWILYQLSHQGSPDKPQNRALKSGSVTCSVVSDSLQLHGTHWAPLSTEFSRQEYYSGLSFLSPGDLPKPGIELWSPALQANSLLSELPGTLTIHYGPHLFWDSSFPQIVHLDPLQTGFCGKFLMR